MRKFLDNLENAAYKLQDLGEKAIRNAKPALDKAIDSAKDACEKAAPAIEDGLDRALQSAKNACAQARPVVEEHLGRAVDEAKNLFAPADAEAEDGAPSGADAPEAPRSADEQIDLDVEAQLEKIRAAQHTPGAFSDYISQKYGKHNS